MLSLVTFWGGEKCYHSSFPNVKNLISSIRHDFHYLMNKKTLSVVLKWVDFTHEMQHSVRMTPIHEPSYKSSYLVIFFKHQNPTSISHEIETAQGLLIFIQLDSLYLLSCWITEKVAMPLLGYSKDDLTVIQPFYTYISVIFYHIIIGWTQTDIIKINKGHFTPSW